VTSYYSKSLTFIRSKYCVTLGVKAVDLADLGNVFDVVVNCSGLGAGFLAKDPKVLLESIVAAIIGSHTSPAAPAAAVPSSLAPSSLAPSSLAHTLAPAPALKFRHLLERVKTTVN
jgi:hypothetical protein